MANDKPTPLPELLLENLALGELSPREAAEARARLETEEGGLERLAALERSTKEILFEHPPRLVAAKIRQKAGLKEKKRSSFLFVLAPVLSMAALALFVTRPAENEPLLDEDIVEVTRTKGESPLIRIYRQTGSGSERLEPGALVKKGDLLQIAYVSMGKGFGVVFSVDGRGSVTLHHPRRPGESQGLLRSGEVLLPMAYELDDAPLFERFFIVGSQEAPLDIDAVLAGARVLARDPERMQSAFLDLPQGLEQYSITLRKEP